MLAPPSSNETSGWRLRVRVLVANEPRSYRQAFAFAVRTLRSYFEVVEVEPEFLDREMLRFRPDVVVCDQVTPTVEAIAHSWLEIRVENEALVVGGSMLAFPIANAELEDLLELIDQSDEQIEQKVTSNR